MSTLTPSAVWRITPELVVALDEELGPPVDSYVNGSQTWLLDGPAGVTLEWRLHPAAGYRTPAGCTHDELWDEVVGQLAAVPDAHDLLLGDEHRALHDVWEGLECFPAYGDEIEPAVLAGAAREAIGIAPDAAGLVDHGRIGDAWERAPGAVSMLSLLFEDLDAR